MIHTTQSCPIDPDQLTSRLLNISSKDALPRPPHKSFDRESLGTTPSPSQLPREEEYEKESFNDLVKDGGRPLYPFELIDEVARDPYSHWDMLRPWVDYLGDPDFESNPNVDWSVFRYQVNSWVDFRWWQKLNRGEPPDWDSSWFEVVPAYQRFVLIFRRRASTYTEAVKKLLAEYDFTQPFQFHEDPTQQNKLTTWIEYLGYECWLHYRLARRVEHMQPKYNADWKALQNSNVLRPFETEEYVCKIDSSFLRQSEREQATQAVKSARAMVESASSDTHNVRDTKPASTVRMQKMEAAEKRLEAAEEALKVVERRNDLCTVFKQAAARYLCTKEDEQRQRLRIQWILEQVPLVEAELGGSNVVSTDSGVVSGTKTRHSRDEDDDVAQNRSIKKQKLNVDRRSLTPSHEPGIGHLKPRTKRKRDDAADTAAENRPRPKRSKRKADSSVPEREALDVAEARLDGNPEIPGTNQSGRRNTNGRMARTTKDPTPKGDRPCSDRLSKRRSENAARASTHKPPPRRSARIAAQREAQITSRADAIKPQARARKRHISSSTPRA